MKKIILTLALCIAAFPTTSHAQLVGYGSPADIGRWPVTCEQPAFSALPNCAPSIPAPPNVPVNFYDAFLFLQTDYGLNLTWGFLAIPIALRLPPDISPSPVLAPGMATLGAMTLGGPTGGFYIPGFPATPYTPCFPSQCIPIAPALGIVTYAGATPSSFGI